MATPAGGVAQAPRPAATLREGVELVFRYVVEDRDPTFAVPVPAGPASDVQLDVEVRVEDGVVFLNALDLDVAVEGEGYPDAVLNLLDATRNWLEYLREESPSLSDELESQQRFVALLDYDPATWFKRLLAE
jgi:hypothetical protein